MTKQWLLIVLLWQMCTSAKAQPADSILYADFSSTSLTPVQPISLQQADSNRTYLYTDKKGSKKERLIFERFSRNKIKRSRSAKLLHTSYGAVISFSTLKTDGYEKVIIFADKDYYIDSLLLLKNGFRYIHRSDDVIRLISVTVITDDSLVVQYASRNTRYDFLHHIRFKPALKDYETWFNISQTGLDYIDTYYLSRKAGATGYTVSTMETTRKSISEYDARTIKEKYLECRSPFWVALEDLSFD